MRAQPPITPIPQSELPAHWPKSNWFTIQQVEQARLAAFEKFLARKTNLGFARRKTVIA